ncbi:DNA-formamidopyrimidine glycosylase [Streptococcus troglodytae]|uniref:Formamidopyrimidine-DNA glycosylase n=1 Tax=Streptococcus troglodytae TaxID=1111760 RepID=A0A1L7LHX0_9STRE|nr:DNA-formamidopyrimidine glycosylase [Streptococcus troglodytae]BAQ23776.1 formamidopyrimidine/5-formyluracil/5-hydroxymethyluracil DNA glycosylase [Streptococcus troglodytae]
MPELPEVETVRRGLEHLIVGKKIVSVEVRVPKMVKTGVEDFQLDILGQIFESIDRRGKYLLLNLNKQTIISHLRMEGKYLLFENEVPDNKHFHLFLGLDDGSTMVYQDVRKFGTFELLPKSQVEAYFIQKKIGPEPKAEDFKLKPFEEGLAKSHKAIKTLLLDQHLVAGLGNIYVDEVLWASQIHPERPASGLTEEEAVLLRQQIIRIMQLAIKNGGSTIRTYRNALGEDGSMQDFLQVYGKTDQPCGRCATPIEKIKVGGRGTHFCPSCQK